MTRAESASRLDILAEELCGVWHGCNSMVNALPLGHTRTMRRNGLLGRFWVFSSHDEGQSSTKSVALTARRREEQSLVVVLSVVVVVAVDAGVVWNKKQRPKPYKHSATLMSRTPAVTPLSRARYPARTAVPQKLPESHQYCYVRTYARNISMVHVCLNVSLSASSQLCHRLAQNHFLDLASRRFLRQHNSVRPRRTWIGKAGTHRQILHHSNPFGTSEAR